MKIDRQENPKTGIVHLRVPQATSLTQFLSAAGMNGIAELLHYGSVYVDGLRMREDRVLKVDQVIRVHTRRKTYVTQIPILRERVVFDHPHFLVVNKPSGLPTHPTLDNYIENASYLLAAELGYPVYVTHRLDVATRGLLILAKSPKAQASINKQFAKRQVEKIYRANLPRALAPALHEHFMDPDSRVPKVMSATAVEGWWDCRLEILDSRHDGGTRIRLLTGRTHQIRAQMALLGAPIDGDVVYGSTRSGRYGQIDLECAELRFRWLQENLAFVTSGRPPEETGPTAPVPS